MFINCTPHTVVIKTGSGPVIALEPEPPPIRIDGQPKGAGMASGVPLIERGYQTSAVDQVARQIIERACRAGNGDAVVVVPTMVLERLDVMIGLHRAALAVVAAPDTGSQSAIRDADGRIVAVRRMKVGPGFARADKKAGAR